MKTKGKPTMAETKAEQPTDVVRTMLVVVEERRDGHWRCEVSGGGDAASMPHSGFKDRRHFLREYHRMLEQLHTFTIRGAVRNQQRRT